MSVSCVYFTFSAFFLIYWIALGNDYDIFDRTLNELLSVEVCAAKSILFLAATLQLHSMICLVMSFCRDIKWLSQKQSQSFFGIKLQACLTTVCVFSFVTVIAIWKESRSTLLLFFLFYAPVMHIIFNLCMASFMALEIKSSSFFSKKLALTFAVNVLLFYFQTKFPSISTQKIYDKPLIFGHRGDQRLAPENTMLALRKADESGCDGYEFDVAISMDGVPFLIHDSFLLRTTNIADVFPLRQHQPPEAFTWSELQLLNAGQWFLTKDPFKTVSSLTTEQIKEISSQKIPSLYQVAIYASKTKKKLIFDYRRPLSVKNHPYLNNHVSVIVEVFKKSNIDPTQVYWISGPNYQFVLNSAPGFSHVYGLPVSDLQVKERKLKGFILEYNAFLPEQVEFFKKKKLSVIAYSYSSAWTFSLAWCEGVDVVLSNNIEMHVSMDKPMLHMSPQYYCILCCLSFLFVFAFLLFYMYVINIKSCRYSTTKNYDAIDTLYSRKD